MARLARTLILVVLTLAVQPASAVAWERAVGFETRTVPGGGGPPIEIAVWYPSSTAASDHRLGGWVQHVALSGVPTAGRHPLVVISHGSGGWYGGHYDTAMALAQEGFVVAALTHPGDNFHDQSGAADMAARPRDLKRLVDYMVAGWPGREHVDEQRVGVFGFSNGGFAALLALGGVPDFSRFGPHCRAHLDFDDCRILAGTGIAPADLSRRFPPSVWTHDPRIRVGVIAAPALGFLFTPEGLTTVRVPIQLWRAADDHVLPHPEYAEAVRQALPRAPDYKVVPDAGHFDFLAPCDPDLAAQVAPICRSNPGFDRISFHRRFNAAVADFFQRALSKGHSHPAELWH